MTVRQMTTPRPKAPRMAPTQIKTVPSGSDEWFMKGAFCVGGTVGAGYSGMPILVRVGRPVKGAVGPVSASVLPIVKGGTLSVPVEVGEVSDAVGVITTLDVLLVVVALAELEETDVDDDELDSSSLFCCANTPEAKRADRSKKRFSDSGGDSMVAMGMSRRLGDD